MSRLRTAAILIFLTGTVCIDAFAKSWRGIVPARSTRADVRKILGKPTKAGQASDYFRFRDYLVEVNYQIESCKGSAGMFGLGYNVPNGTVVEIAVLPTQAVSREGLLASGDFKRQALELDFVYYTDAIAGLTVETHKDRVTLVQYSPEKAEDNLRCPRDPKFTMDVFPRFDEYGNLSFADEKARLDNFVHVVLEGIARGAIVVYGENPAARRTLLKRAERAKDYLVKVRGLEPQRLFILDGGYKEESSTELQLKAMTGFNSTMIFFPASDPVKNP